MKNVIDFLQRLSRNNDREWFEAHKAEYRSVLAEFNDFVALLIEGIGGFDDSVRGLTVKDCTYRIYRDTRFSKDKTPYKAHMGAYIAPGGKNAGSAGYYFHIEPEGSGMLGGHMLTSGLYMPEPKILKSVREDIMYDGEGFLKDISRAAGFRLGTENALKRMPLGFPADTPYAEYIKLKDIYLEMRVDDKFVKGKDFLAESVAAYEKTYDFVKRLNRTVRYAREEM